MAIINWSDEYSVKVKVFDDHHKKLIGYINDLHAALAAGKGNDALGEILKKLINYTDKHFAAEEMVMQKFNYFDYPMHKKEHENLKKEVKDFYDKFQRKEISVSTNLFNFLKSWLINHIEKTDKKYTEFMNKHIA